MPELAKQKKREIIQEEKGFKFGQGLAGSTPGLKMENRKQTPLTLLVELVEGKEYKTVTRNLAIKSQTKSVQYVALSKEIH